MGATGEYHKVALICCGLLVKEDNKSVTDTVIHRYTYR